MTAMTSQSLKTVEEVRGWLERHGVTTSEWARAHGFAPGVVFFVLSGRTVGRRGAAHRVAAALGLKAVPDQKDQHPLAGTAVVPAITSLLNGDVP